MPRRNATSSGWFWKGKRPPYFPWSMGFTQEAKTLRQAHWKTSDVEGPLGNHLLRLGHDIGFFTIHGEHHLAPSTGSK